MSLIHLPTKSGSVEFTSWDFFLRLFRNYVCHHFIFPIFNQRRGGGLENFSKISKR